tara:strand:- start:145 stop:399 length:255 start_codon:yes stop_codon:yes gene_type:complete
MILDSKHIRWCWDNGIFFCPKPLNSIGTVVVIEMIKKGRCKPGTEKFSHDTPMQKRKVYDKIDELYLTVFKKNVKDGIEERFLG